MQHQQHERISLHTSTTTNPTMPTSTPIPVTPATRMRIATMYTGAGAMDYGYVRASRDDDANVNACREREKAQPPFRV